MKTFFSCLWLAAFSVMLCFFIGCFYGYLYPMKYKDQIMVYASKNNLNPALVAAVINVESSYRENRVSSKGAIGLMQIMPETAKWIAKKLDYNFDNIDLFNPKTNIEFGSFYLGYLKKYFGDEKLSICAYNAGMGNVKKWVNDKNFSEKGGLKNIPFKETDDYLNKILLNLKYYKNKYR